MLSVGIVGLPNVGKSTLFNALLKKQQALVANYPFATIEPNVGVVPVPDGRLEKLRNLVIEEFKGSKPEEIHATVRFVDIAGLVKGASQGEGLGNQFLSHIREVDAIVEVVRVFEDENIIRSGAVDPKSDMEVVKTELILADLETIQKSQPKAGPPRAEKIKNQNDRSKISAKGGLVSSKLSVDAGSLRSNQKNQHRLTAIEKLKVGLNSGQLASEVSLTDEEREAIRDLQLLTAKPILYVFNVSERQLAQGLKGLDPLLLGTIGSNPINPTGPSPLKPLVICAQVEAELSALNEIEGKEYLAQLGVKESGLDAVIRAGYEALGLISFLTAGPKEVRAWTLRRGATALRASGTIHSDFERGFIAAEVIAYDHLLSSGSRQKAKELGQIRLEGKDYEMMDGDVVEFRFSV